MIERDWFKRTLDVLVAALGAALAETFLQWADVLRAAGRAQEADWAAQRAQECAAYQVRE